MSKYKYWRQTFFNFIDKDNKSFLKVYFGESLSLCPFVYVAPNVGLENHYFITFFILVGYIPHSSEIGGL